MSTAAAKSVQLVPTGALGLEAMGRETRDDGVVVEYAAAIKAGHSFPPVLVYNDRGTLWLVDGYHRLLAHQRNDRANIVAEVRQGSYEDALWEGCAANQSNGLRRTNSDKRRSVMNALLHPKGRRLSDRQIASHCGVHHHTVGRIRAELEASGALGHIAQRVAKRGSVVYQLGIDGVSASNRRRVQAASAAAQSEACAAAPDAYEVPHSGLDMRAPQVGESGAIRQIATCEPPADDSRNAANLKELSERNGRATASGLDVSVKEQQPSRLTRCVVRAGEHVGRAVAILVEAQQDPFAVTCEASDAAAVEALSGLQAKVASLHNALDRLVMSLRKPPMGQAKAESVIADVSA